MKSLPFLGMMLLVTVLQAAPAATHEGLSATGRRPNLVLIMADDLGYGSPGCYGGAPSDTPQIDRLAAGGMRFTDFHGNGPLCSPTRAALLTGRYPQRCIWVPDSELSPVFREQRRQNMKQRWAWGIGRSELTIAGLLQKAGYRTGLVGKWHLGYDLAFHPCNHGFDEFRGFMGGNVDYHTHIAGYGLKQHDWWIDRNPAKERGYTTDLLTAHAVSFVARHKGRPFFLCLAHAAPHDPWQGRDPHGRKSPAETYREMIRALDESVGAVVSAIREHGLEKNTLVMFCSDNGAAPPPGVAANGRLRGRKGSLFEGGHRVPFIASWHGVIAAGSVQNGPAMMMDLFPTMAGIAGAKPPADHKIDGIDLLPVLKGGQATERILHWQSGDHWAVRQGEWKLMGTGARAVTLVNLRDDPSEKVSMLSKQPELSARMMSLHRRWAELVGDR